MKELFKALAEFQQECPTIQKTTTGYNYKYADLPSILKVINPLLAKHGLAFSQPLMQEEDKTVVQTILYHLESEEMLSSSIEIPKVQLGTMNDYQSLGSGITYLRRYALSSILGIVTDEDTDAAGEQVNKPTTKNAAQAKEFPWMTQKMFESSVKRIQEANPNIVIHEDGNEYELSPKEFVDKLCGSLRMKKDYKESLLHEVNFQNTLNKVEDPKQQTIL